VRFIRALSRNAGGRCGSPRKNICKDEINRRGEAADRAARGRAPDACQCGARLRSGARGSASYRPSLRRAERRPARTGSERTYQRINHDPSQRLNRRRANQSSVVSLNFSELQRHCHHPRRSLAAYRFSLAGNPRASRAHAALFRSVFALRSRDFHSRFNLLSPKQSFNRDAHLKNRQTRPCPPIGSPCLTSARRSSAARRDLRLRSRSMSPCCSCS
jgi:hypothetical protein